MRDEDNTHYSYDEYVRLMYLKGYYVSPYNINIKSREVHYLENKIFIVPIALDGENVVYVFTGKIQKIRMLSEATEFRLIYVEDKEGNEFKDNDNIMLSLVKPNGIVNLYTRNYATWKFGVKFDNGIHLEQDKYLIFQAQKDIGKFEIEIDNIDLFKYKNKTEKKHERMLWLD